MSEPEIMPAMTAAQWASTPSSAGYAMARLQQDEGYTRHALAALALHGQPFGFTWEMVDAIRAAVDSGALNDADDETLLAAADRIAALLPPREAKP